MSDKITIRELAKLLECPVCLQHWEAGSVLLQCHNGHSICQDCYSKLFTCPICRIKLRLRRDIKTISDKLMIAMEQELRHVENEDGTIWISDLLKFFQCTICKYFPTRHPTWQCVNGHLICAECRVNTSYCACKIFIYNTYARNLLAQRILELTEKPCRFTRHGCKAVIKDLNHHEKEECIYREVFCIFYNCSKQLPMVHLNDHLEELNPKHDNFKNPLNLNFGEELEKGCGILKLSSYWDKPYPCLSLDTINYMKLNNKVFGFVCWADSFKKRCMLWVYSLDLTYGANNVGFKLRLFNEDSKKEIHVTGPVVPVDMSHVDLNHHPLSFKLTFKDIKEYWSQDSITFSWEVIVFEKNSSVLNELISVQKY
jgi:hypothetical protein